MTVAISLFLKLCSFHHVLADNRYLVQRISLTKKQSTGELAAHFNIQVDTFALAASYPDNLRLGHYLRFIFAPTCCYQNVYPTTPSIRLTFILKRLVELVFCNLLMVHIAY